MHRCVSPVAYRTMIGRCLERWFVCITRMVLGAALVIVSGSPAGALTAEQWREDLAFLAREIPRRHANAYHTLSPEDFAAAVEALDVRIPDLEDHEVVVELATLVAMIGDGHTRLTLPRDAHVGYSQSHSRTPDPHDPDLIFHHLPIRLTAFADGLFVTEATPEQASLLGMRVTRVGSASAESAMDAVTPVIHRDNDMFVLLYGPVLLTVPEVVAAVGLSERTDRVRFEFESADGLRQTAELTPLTSNAPVTWLAARETDSAAVPLWLRDPGTHFWYEYLDDTGVLFVQYNAVQDQEGETVAGFAERLEFAIVDLAPQCVVIDVRHNGGGNNSLNLPLLHVFIRQVQINLRGRLYVIIGRRTFSAAMNYVEEMEKHTNVIFVGEPSGGRPNSYGDSRRSRLPNSGLTVRISTLYWQSHPRDDRPWIPPELAVELTSTDYLTNHDPALAAILVHEAGPSLETMLEETLTAGDLAGALEGYRHFKADPSHRYVDTEWLMNEVGYYLLGAGHSDAAIEVFTLNVEAYPRSANVYDSLGEAYLSAGNRELAIENYERSVELNPGNTNGIEMLQRFRETPSSGPPGHDQ